MYTKECPRLLVMVFGAPGSGKSAFADHLERTIKNEQQGQNVAVLSTDCIQEFIQRHGASPPLREACTPQFRCSYRLRRNEFSDKAWKISREYVKTGICNLLEGIPLVIVEDDLLLNSQRKPFRRVAAQK